MSTPNLEYIPNNTIFFTKLSGIHAELDLNTTLTMSRFSFADVQGEEYCSYCISDFISAYNERFGKTMNPETSMTAGKGSWLVEFYEDVEVKQSTQKEEKVDAVQEKTEPLISLEAKEEKEEVVVEETAPTVPDVDWDYVHGLKNTKSDKKALDEYAETFGAKLNRVKKIENMIADFKEHMGVE